MICNTELEHVFQGKDLSVMMDEDLRFEDHISLKVNKANSIIGLIRSFDGELFKRLYTTAVWAPHLEVAVWAPHLEVAVWAPHLVNYKDVIENVQKRATKLVNGFSNLEYSQRLRKLELGYSRIKLVH